MFRFNSAAAIRPRAAAAVALVAAAACGDTPAAPACSVQSVSISGLPDTLAALQATQLSAAVTPAACAGAEVSWSAAPGLAITPTGVVTGELLGGPFTVTARAYDVADTAATTVVMAPVSADARWAVAAVAHQDADEYEPPGFSTGGSIRSTRTGAGGYAVRFAGLAAAPGQRQAVHVSPILFLIDPPRRCRVLSVVNDGADLLVQVRCHDLSGAPADSWFSILVAPAGATQGRSAFVVTPPSVSDALEAATTHNSTGQLIRVERTQLGRYTVIFEGLARQDIATQKETFQITPYGAGTDWCSIDFWNPPAVSSSDLALHVFCFTAAGAPADARFAVLMLERGRAGGQRLGYVWAHDPASADYTPTASFSFNSSGAENTARRSSTGAYAISWPGLEHTSSSTLEANLITAYGSPDGAYCQVVYWVVEPEPRTYVRCFAPNGDPADARFTALWIE
jgi:hypothetical protein